MYQAKLVALMGYAGSGKDAAANYLIEKGFIKVAFADALKEISSKIYGFPRELLEDRDYKETIIESLGVTPREILQSLGTEGFKDDLKFKIALDILRCADLEDVVNFVYSDVSVTKYTAQEVISLIRGGVGFRFIYENTWVEKAYQTINDLMIKGKSVVTTDTRFLNEVLAAKQAGGTIYFIRRSSVDTSTSLYLHASEQLDNLIDLCDGIIFNNGTLEDLKWAILGATQSN